MQPLLIIAELDVPHNILSGVFPSRIYGTMNTFVLQSRKERLRHRIVVTDTGSADGLADIVCFEERRELVGSVITATVRIKPNSV
jgi:hypothetical protein